MKQETAERLAEWQSQIAKSNEDAMQEAKARWDRVAKPLDGLGRFEELIVQIAGITGSAEVSLDKAAVLVFCADNGVVTEGVTQTDQSVTAAVARSLAKGTANVNRMAEAAKIDVLPVDIGIAGELSVPGLLPWNVRHGTGNIRVESAMTEEEAVFAIAGGIELVRLCKRKGYHILATGEMGIGNTTTSAALAAALLSLPAEEVTGTGAGLSKERLAIKKRVVADAVQRVRGADPFSCLCGLGGLDIAGLIGVFLGGAIYRIPIILDGAISGIAALLAARLFPGCEGAMLASHVGKEPVCRRVLSELSLSPVIDADLALGEGTGAVLLVPLLRMALSVYRTGASFEEIEVEKYKRFEDN